MRHREFFIRQTRKVIGASVFPYMLATDRIPCCDALCLIFVLFTLLLFSNHNFLFIFLSPRSGDHHFHHILLFNQNLLSFFLFSQKSNRCVCSRARAHITSNQNKHWVRHCRVDGHGGKMWKHWRRKEIAAAFQCSLSFECVVRVYVSVCLFRFIPIKNKTMFMKNELSTTNEE